MSKSWRSSSVFVRCRIEWRPSRWLGAMLWALVVLAPLSLLASDLPRSLAWPGAFAAAAWAMFEARRYRRQPPRRLTIPAGRGIANCDDVRIDGLQLAWRGPLAFLQWRDAQGRRQRASFWPDTLPAGTRRELKLAMQRRQAAAGAASMAG